MIQINLMVEAIIFDMDGVVVDTEQYWAEAENDIYRKATGVEVDTTQFSGMSISNTYHKLSEKYGTKITGKEFLELYREHAETIYKQKASIMEGFKDLINYLRSQNIKLGLATGSHWPEYVIKRYSLNFDAVVTPEELQGNGKPEPETYTKLLEKIDADTSKTVVIEDSDPGVKSAKAAALYCIGYNNTDGQKLDEADYIADNASELRDKIIQLTKNGLPPEK